MADFGLIIRNQDNFIQIDSTYANLGLTSKGTTTAPDYAGGLNGGYYQGYVTVTGINPIIALSSTDYCKVRMMTQSGNSFTFYIWCKTQNQSFDYYVFDSPGIISLSGNYGLQVFNNGGSKVFDSRIPYMRVKDVRTMYYGSTQPPGTDTPTDSAQYVSLGKIAVIESQAIKYYSVVQLPGGNPGDPPVVIFNSHSVFKTSSNVYNAIVDSVGTSNYSRGSEAPQGISAGNRNSMHMIIDVTNY